MAKRAALEVTGEDPAQDAPELEGDAVPAAQQEPEPVESEPTPTPPGPVLARATISFVLDQIDMSTDDPPRELPAHVFDRLASLGLVERA